MILNINQLLALVFVIFSLLSLFITTPLVKKRMQEQTNSTDQQKQVQALVIKILNGFAYFMLLAAAGLYIIEPL